MSDIEGTCFVVSPIGSEGSDTRERADHLLNSVIEPALKPFDMSVERADDIQEQGIITNQIIQRLVSSELVIADLSGSNANVFYELAIRHAAEKPYIQLIDENDDIPFDLQDTRTIPYNLCSVPLTNKSKESMQALIRSQFEDDKPLDSPVSVGMKILQMKSTGESQDFEMADILENISNIQSSINHLQREFDKQKEIKIGLDPSNEYKEDFDKVRLEHERLSRHFNELRSSLEDNSDFELSNDIVSSFEQIEIDLTRLEEYILDLKQSLQ